MKNKFEQPIAFPFTKRKRRESKVRQLANNFVPPEVPILLSEQQQNFLDGITEILNNDLRSKTPSGRHVLAESSRIMSTQKNPFLLSLVRQGDCVVYELRRKGETLVESAYTSFLLHFFLCFEQTAYFGLGKRLQNEEALCVPDDRQGKDVYYLLRRHGLRVYPSVSQVIYQQQRKSEIFDKINLRLSSISTRQQERNNR